MRFEEAVVHEAVTPRGCADGDGPAMAEAGLRVVEARVVAVRRGGVGGGSGGGGGGGGGSSAKSTGKSAAAVNSAVGGDRGGGGGGAGGEDRDHRDVGEADGHLVGGRWVETQTHGGGGGGGSGGSQGGIDGGGGGGGGGGVVVLAAELAMTGRASNAGEAARVAAAVATPAFMSDLEAFGIVTKPEEAAGFRAFVVESEEAPEDIRVARGAAAGAAAAVEALQDFVAAAKEAAALSLEGTTTSITTAAAAAATAAAARAAGGGSAPLYSATESPAAGTAAAAAAAVAAADASLVAEDHVQALVEACAAVEPTGRLERCYPQFVARCTELIAEQRRWAKEARVLLNKRRKWRGGCKSNSVDP